jgi:four helix bundle protein
MPRDTSQLRVFQDADRLAIDIYRATTELPSSDRHELGRQLRRSALSVPTNLLEGGQRLSTRDYRHYVGIALGSAAETRYLLTVAQRLGLMSSSAGGLISDYEVLCRALHKLHTTIGAMPDTHRP